MKHSPHLKLTLLLLLLLPLAAMAQPYIITANGTSTTQFTATKGGSTIGTANQTLQIVIDAIRTDANGADCSIQFGSGSADTLKIGNASAEFNNTGGTWGNITLLGNITSSGNTIIWVDGPSLESKASIQATGNYYSSIVNYGTGTITISGGTISTINNSAVINSSTGKIIISGDANITSAYASTTSGTIYNGSGTIEITGGTISNTIEGNNAVYNKSSGSILLGGSPNITGIIKKAGSGNLNVITNPNIGTVFAPGNKIYILDFTTAVEANDVAVVNGKNFLENFPDANYYFGLIASGEDLVFRLKSFSYAKSAGNIYTITSSFDASSTIASVIAAIKTDAGGADCSIQFGNGESKLNIGPESITFSNTDGKWGNITLLGDITNIANDPAIIVSGPNLESKANIIKTNAYAIRNSGTGTLTISGGSLSSGSPSNNTFGVVQNSSIGAVIISGGTISAIDGNYNAAVLSSSTGKVTISGTANLTSITSQHCTSGAPMGTIHIANSGSLTDIRLEITGGTINSTGTYGNAICNLSTGAVAISGGTISASVSNGYTGNSNKRWQYFGICKK